MNYIATDVCLLKLPLVVLEAINAIAKSEPEDFVIPLVAGFSNPFLANWQTLERVALASILVHIQLVEPFILLRKVSSLIKHLHTN